MRAVLLHFLRVFPALLIALAAQAEPQPIPDPPQLPVRAHILMDFHSGAVLTESNADQAMEPASITKLMASYVIYRHLGDGSITLADPVTISEKAWRMGGSRMFVEVGTQVSVDDLLRGVVVQSGNDATVALAEYVAGNEDTFTELMNRAAANLGMKNSHFVNASGWPAPEHLMSARDIAILARAVIREFPDYYAQYKVREFTYNAITQHNRNRLLWRDDSVDGIKTGHTQSAGYCLSASAQRGDTRLISVVLGAKNENDRFSASQALLDYGFRFYETHKIYDASRQLTHVRVWKGAENEVPLGLAEALYVTIPKGRYEELNATLSLDDQIEAPVEKMAPLGRVSVTLGGKTVAQAPLVALKDVPRAGIMGRAWDSMMMMFSSFFD